MPLEVRYFRAGEEDVLSGTSCRLLFLDLEFHDVRRVLHNLRDIGAVPGADLAKDTFSDPDNTANEPVPL